jgi:cupin fold WbuC family metalloprotein
LHHQFTRSRAEGSANVPAAKILQAGDLKEVAEGIFYGSEQLPLVNQEVIGVLKQAARTNSKRRARFCAHASADAEQHDMLIVSHRDTYVAPHRHLNKSESFVIIEGSAVILLFDENGTLESTVSMGDPWSGKPFFYRMPPRQYHSLSIDSELLVFIESTKGPFRLGESENAAWAPGPEDGTNGKTYIASTLDGSRT